MVEVDEKTVNLKKIKQNKDKEKELNNTQIVDDLQEIQSIDRPLTKNSKFWPYLNKIFLLLVAGALVYFSYTFLVKYSTKNKNKENTNEWYAITLKSNKVYYGQIDDKTTNPVRIKNVYYDYDQEKNSKKDQGSIRLVKKGSEVHGPDSVVDVYQANIEQIELLRSDSKILQAISDNENKIKR